MNYKIEVKDNIRYIVVNRLNELGVKHCFTSKDMDLGVTTNKSIEDVKDNIKKVYEFLQVSPLILYNGYQSHSNNVEIIKDTNQGLENELGRFFPETDGLVTQVPNIATITRFADCTPIILYDKNKRVVANLHSGWKGTLKRIASKGLKEMIRNYDTDSKDIIAVLGPSIGRYDFEVDADVKELFQEEFGYMEDIILKKNDEKYLIDLQKINKNILLEEGISEENIEIVDLSTVKNEYLHSYRRDKANYGLMGSIVVL